MNLMGLFRSPQNELEKGGTRGVEDHVGIQVTCPSCGKSQTENDLWDNYNVCTECGYHYRLTARQRLDYLMDSDSFEEMNRDMRSRDILGFPGYEAKLRNAQLASREKEGVICGTGKIQGEPVAVFVMDAKYMMGSMGTVVGEKITQLFECATLLRLPVVGCTVSGGARMQEGILSLMQMAKTSAAVKQHSDAGLFYLTVLTDPTTGGVTASFAMGGDIIMAEPGATVGFAGARVIEQTIRRKLPQGFQKSEFLLEHGFIDLVVPRKNHKTVVAQLLQLHQPPQEDEAEEKQIRPRGDSSTQVGSAPARSDSMGGREREAAALTPEPSRKTTEASGDARKVSEAPEAVGETPGPAESLRKIPAEISDSPSRSAAAPEELRHKPLLSRSDLSAEQLRKSRQEIAPPEGAAGEQHQRSRQGIAHWMERQNTKSRKTEQGTPKTPEPSGKGNPVLDKMKRIADEFRKKEESAQPAPSKEEQGAAAENRMKGEVI